MARLDVYHSPSRGGTGYVIDVQADLLSHLATRVVVPLLPSGTTAQPAAELNPIFDIEGEPHIMLTQAIGTVFARDLKRKVAVLAEHHDAVTRALDILLVGF